jgi:HK97 gp10 family phage protein
MSNQTQANNRLVLRAFSARLRLGAAKEAVRAGLAVLEAGCKRRCPVGVTHELVDSIHTVAPKVTGKGVSGAVVVSSGHALAVEYGTSREAAQPFVRPTKDLDGPRAIQVMKEELNRR